MFTFNPKISRRDTLKALGVLGILNATQIQKLSAQSSAPVRVLLVALQHGWGISGGSNRNMSGSEFDFSFPNGLDPFNDIKQHSVVVDGLLTLGLWGNNHDLSYADIFTAGVPNGEEGSDFDSHMPLSVTPSLDYLLEQASGKPTFRFSAGYRSWGVRHHPMSFDNNGTVLPYYTKASDAYESLFANLPDNGAVTPQQDSESAIIESVFQFIRNPSLQSRNDHLSAEEKAKLERYLTAAEAVEVKKRPVQGYAGTERLSSIPSSSQSRLEDVSSFLDMVKVGFANNLTTSAVLGIGDLHSIDKFHHDHAHGNTDIWWDTRRDFAQHITRFVNELATVQDFDGNSLLHNTVIVLSGEVGDGGHNIINKGHIVFGNGGGQIQTGRYLKQAVVSGASNIQSLMREDINGTLQRQITFGNQHTQQAGTRTNADILRDVGNIAGLNLTEFGLPSQNKGNVLIS